MKQQPTYSFGDVISLGEVFAVFAVCWVNDHIGPHKFTAFLLLISQHCHKTCGKFQAEAENAKIGKEKRIDCIDKTEDYSDGHGSCGFTNTKEFL